MLVSEIQLACVALVGCMSTGHSSSEHFRNQMYSGAPSSMFLTVMRTFFSFHPLIRSVDNSVFSPVIHYFFTKPKLNESVHQPSHISLLQVLHHTCLSVNLFLLQEL